jgi:nicotinamide mononucleotide transporter
LSVLFAKGEHLGLSTGLIATIISVYLLFIAGYLGDMINGYFTIMSFMAGTNGPEK